MAVRRKYIRSLVEQLLKTNRVRSAPVPIEKLANSLGVSVLREPTDDDLSGFLYRDQNRKTAVIGVNANHHSNRQNFTIGHEIGHFLLHEGNEVHVDRGFQIKLRGINAKQGIDIDEKEANLFAAEVLMPASFLKNDLEKINQLDLDNEVVVGKLAQKYGVSAGNNV